MGAHFRFFVGLTAIFAAGVFPNNVSALAQPQEPSDPSATTSSNVTEGSGEFGRRTREIVREQIERLERESLEESLAKYGDVDLFYYHGAFMQGDGSSGLNPLPPEVGYEEAGIILSNRRTSKLIEELQAIPTDRAAQLIEEQLMKSLALYREEYRERFLDNQRFRDSRRTHSFKIGNNADGTPTFKGLKHSILGLVLIAGTLDLDGAWDSVLAVAAEAKSQRDNFYALAGNAYQDFRISHAVERGGLYNRQILALSLAQLGNMDQDAFDAELAAVAARYFARIESEPSDAKNWTAMGLNSFRQEKSFSFFSATPHHLLLRAPQSDISDWRYAVELPVLIDDEGFNAIFEYVTEKR